MVLKLRSDIKKSNPKASAKKSTKKRIILPMSGAEQHLRAYLVSKGLMKNEKDNQGLYNWLMGMVKPNEDPRSQWEKDLTARVAEKLGKK